MTADISRSDSDTAIPIRDVNMTLNIPADSEDKATSYISNLQRAAMDTVEIWLESNIHGSDSRDEARYSEYHFEAEELTVEVNLY
ncbi:hypothetical protein C497_01715 [Halalkalicoccus jeotgali B3]|uniref:Uncharacterized protein n=2 Tax=Halalkalicoccus jeotgali TaxID=413810 RepID=L9VWR2_HALJB|nr:hypothetical protein C497_01715 [Halalkalicoccus jeotgali B3]